METSFANRAVRLLIAEDHGSARQMLSECFRGLGFLEVTVVATGEDVFNALEHDDCDWIVMPMFLQQSVTAFHVLKAISENPHLRRVRVSLLIDKEEESYLAAAFHLGLLSWHAKNYSQQYVTEEIDKLLELMKTHNWSLTLVAAEYFRTHMNSVQNYEPLLQVEKDLLGFFPGSLNLLLRYGEVQLRSGLVPEGMCTLGQACLLDERAKKTAEAITERYTTRKINERYSNVTGQNVLGIKTCVIIDPDSSVLTSLRSAISMLGVPHIELFEDGEKAWAWLSVNPEPDLILQEWRIPGLSGALLLQRIRHHGFTNVPVNVISSVIKPEESHLLREFGVANVIAKPFAPQSLFKSLTWTLQQHIHPTEQNSLQQKIVRLLQNSEFFEAARLRNKFLADPKIKTSCKKTVDAHYAYGLGNYRQARDLAMESLKLQGDALCLLNLVGKAMLKLRDCSSAVKVFQKAHSMSQMNIENLCLLALAHYDSGSVDESIMALKAAKQIDPSSPMIIETECQIALAGGDSSRAVTLMRNIPNLKGILAAMNERGSYLVKTGQFEAGLTIYRRTLEALPASRNDEKDEVRYNQSLAFALYGELQKAYEGLDRIVQRQDSAFYQPSLRLKARVETSLQKKTPVPFYEALFNVERGDNSQDRKPNKIYGMLCLNGIYQLDRRDEQELASLTKSAPNFIDKSSRKSFFAKRGV